MRDMGFKRPLKNVVLGRVNLHYSVTMLKPGVIPIPPQETRLVLPELPLDCHNDRNEPIQDNVMWKNWLD